MGARGKRVVAQGQVLGYGRDLMSSLQDRCTTSCVFEKYGTEFGLIHQCNRTFYRQVICTLTPTSLALCQCRKLCINMPGSFTSKTSGAQSSVGGVHDEDDPVARHPGNHCMVVAFLHLHLAHESHILAYILRVM